MGPLQGVKVVELAGIGPGPFCGMMLADMGAEVLRIDRKSGGGAPVDIDTSKDIVARGRSSISLDLKSPQGQAMALDAIAAADMVFEGFRPGVAERLGLGPEACLARNPALIYGRMTGWGQSGPLALHAGHDINYIALSGALSMIGRKGEAPVPPINLVGDYGGGGMLLAFGMVCALIEARRSGIGQVVDAAMYEGTSLLMSATRSLMAMGHWTDERGANMCDTGSHFYEVYETLDGAFMAVGAVEPQFYAQLLQGLELDPATLGEQMDPKAWPAAKTVVAEKFRTKTRAEWRDVFDNTDACVTPVLTLAEAEAHSHSLSRQAYIEIDGLVQPAPAPRFSRTAPEITKGSPAPGAGGDDVLIGWGLSPETISACRKQGAML